MYTFFVSSIRHSLASEESQYIEKWARDNLNRALNASYQFINAVRNWVNSPKIEKNTHNVLLSIVRLMHELTIAWESIIASCVSIKSVEFIFHFGLNWRTRKTKTERVWAFCCLVFNWMELVIHLSFGVFSSASSLPRWNVMTAKQMDENASLKPKNSARTLQFWAARFGALSFSVVRNQKKRYLWKMPKICNFWSNRSWIGIQFELYDTWKWYSHSRSVAEALNRLCPIAHRSRTIN